MYHYAVSSSILLCSFPMHQFDQPFDGNDRKAAFVSIVYRGDAG